MHKPDTKAPKGTLLIIGGHENKDGKIHKKVQEESDPLKILKTFIALMGKKEPTIEVITTASEEPAETFADYLKIFTSLGAVRVQQIYHKERVDALGDGLIERIKAADGVFIAGGDQLRLTAIYGGTLVLRQLFERYQQDHFVLAGTSAGAMAFSTPMIFAGNKARQQLAGEIRITTGLEFLKNVCIDTHFVDRGRFVRMAQVIATNPSCIGLGIEEDTALVIKNGTEADVIGTGVVIVAEGFNISHSNITSYGSGHAISIKNLTVSLLSEGDTYQIPTINPTQRH